MLKRLFGFFSLERRMGEELGKVLQLSSQSMSSQVSLFEKRVSATTQQFDRFSAEMRERLSRIEVLFAEELAAKEKARDELVKQKRLEAR